MISKKVEVKNKVETPKVEEKQKKQEKTTEVKKEQVKVKKEEAMVLFTSFPVSTKYAMDICKFIKRKKIPYCISYLEEVIAKKKVMPMKGEYAHRKGEGMMSGKYPRQASEKFIMALKSLAANAVFNGLEDPVIVEAIANYGQRPHSKMGRWQKKRTWLKIVAKNKIKKQIK
jgi:ribosomal protein L22